MLPIAANHPRANDVALHGGIRGRRINIRENLPRLLPAGDSQVLHGFPLEIGITLAFGDLGDDILCLRRTALRQEKQGVGLHLRASGAVQHLFNCRHALFRVALHATSQGQYFEFVVVLVDTYRLVRRLLYLELEHTGVFRPPALRKALLEIRNRRQRGILLPEFVLGVRFPVERRVRLRPVHIGEFTEFRGGFVELVVIQRFAPVVVQFLEPLDFLLGTVTRLLLAVTFFLFTFPSFLFAIALFLLAVLRILVLPGFHGCRSRACRRRFQHARRDQQQRRCRTRLYGFARSFCDAHALFLSLVSDPVGDGAEFALSCSSFPTTRTLNKMPCSSMRFCSDSSFAGVISSGLCATSISTRSRSSSTLASAASPSCLAVSRYKRLASSKSSARFCSAEISICFAPCSAGAAFANSINTISDLP